MQDYYTCKLAVCTMESKVFRLRKTGLQKEPGFGNLKYDHHDGQIGPECRSGVVKALWSLVNSVLGHLGPLKKTEVTKDQSGCNSSSVETS